MYLYFLSIKCYMLDPMPLSEKMLKFCLIISYFSVMLSPGLVMILTNVLNLVHCYATMYSYVYYFI